MLDFLNEHEGVNSIKLILKAADGEIVGRTRLQKIAYLLKLSGFDNNFEFEYKHYGPFSRDVAQATDFAELAGVLSEETKPASWGGTYSIFKLTNEGIDLEVDGFMSELVQKASCVNSVVLELAATAAFLSKDYDNPWKETVRRKPKKATFDNLQKAKSFYQEISGVQTPNQLPALN